MIRSPSSWVGRGPTTSWMPSGGPAGADTSTSGRVVAGSAGPTSARRAAASTAPWARSRDRPRGKRSEQTKNEQVNTPSAARRMPWTTCIDEFHARSTRRRHRPAAAGGGMQLIGSSSARSARARHHIAGLDRQMLDQEVSKGVTSSSSTSARLKTALPRGLHHRRALSDKMTARAATNGSPARTVTPIPCVEEPRAVSTATHQQHSPPSRQTQVIPTSGPQHRRPSSHRWRRPQMVSQPGTHHGRNEEGHHDGAVPRGRSLTRQIPV